MPSNFEYKGPKLVGRFNYIEWLKEASIFLEIGGYMPYIDGSEPNLISFRFLYYNNTNITRSLELAVKYIEREADFKRNTKKALGAIKAIISNDNKNRFKDKIDASQLWQAYKNIFSESNIKIIGRYFNKIIDCNLDFFDSADKYISYIQFSVLYLSELEYAILKPYIALILFKRLPNSYNNFYSRKYKNISRNIKDININKLISDIINESVRLGSNISGLVNKINNKKSKYCIYCKNKGFNGKNHLEEDYFFKYPKLKSNNNKNKADTTNKTKGKKFKSTKNNNNKYKNESTKAIMRVKSIKSMIITYRSNINNINNINKNQNKKILTKFFKKIIDKIFNNIIFDFSVTDHYCPNKDWLINYKALDNKTSINTTTGEPCQILGYRDLPILINNNKILITYIYYIPKLKNILINEYKLFLKGWRYINDINNNRLVYIEINITVPLYWHKNAFYLDILIDYNRLERIIYKVQKGINNIKITKMDLIYKRLNHLNKDYINKTIQSILGLGLNI